MSDILSILGLDQKDVKWYHLGACSNLMQSMLNLKAKNISKVDPFFDGYESDKVIAEQSDALCLSCPVIQKCYKEGVKNKEQGVWGGVYLDGQGRADKNINSHKTPEIWKELKKLHGKIFIH